MIHIDSKIIALRDGLIDMFLLVQKQLQKSIEAIVAADKQIAQQVLETERQVNEREIIIDKDCEHFVALFNPVAMDLRFVFAIFKINSHLESIGDAAKGISRFTLEMEKKLDNSLIDELQIMRMYEIANSMIEDNLTALRTDDSSLSRAIFKKEKEINAINKQATTIVANYMSQRTTEVLPLLNLISAIRKLERVGDLNVHIAEEIIFYLEANVLKHENEK